MSVVILPTLSDKHWVVDPVSKADMLFAHFMAGSNTQTYMYTSEVSSLPYLLQKYGHNPNEFATNVKTRLQIYYQRYYDNVDIQVYAKEEVEGTNRYSIHLDMIVSDDGGKEIQLGRILTINDGKMQKVVKLNATGS